MKYMISKAKKKKIYTNKPTGDETSKIYSEIAGCIISLNDNNRCEPYLLHSHVRYHIQKEKRLKGLQ